MRITLDCDHVSIFTSHMPNFGDRLWCVECDDAKTVVHVEQWILNCQDCKHNQRSRTEKESIHLAERHSQRRGHHVKVKNPSGIVAWDISPDTIPMI